MNEFNKAILSLVRSGISIVPFDREVSKLIRGHALPAPDDWKYTRALALYELLGNSQFNTLWAPMDRALEFRPKYEGPTIRVECDDDTGYTVIYPVAEEKENETYDCPFRTRDAVGRWLVVKLGEMTPKDFEEENA